ncbi:MAG: hypothetical protein R3F19_05775 [Verrucomicrobiales bacterium]
MLCAIGCWWLGGTKGRTLPPVEKIERQTYQAPVQEPTSKEAFNVVLKDKPYRVQPRFSYDIHGLVVSEHHSDSLLDIYHRMTGDFLNVCDLAMVWGVNAKSGIYKKGKFHNQDFTAWVQYDDGVAWSTFRMNEFSNNHLLSENASIRSRLQRIQVGDQVRIKGWLAEYFAPPSYHRGTSTTRDDTGGHACETIYVTDVELIRSANTGWRMLGTIGKVIALTLVGIQLVVFVQKWRHRNRPVDH